MSPDRACPAVIGKAGPVIRDGTSVQRKQRTSKNQNCRTGEGTLDRKRRYKRLKLNCPAIITVHPDSREKKIYLLRIANISTAGAMFVTEIQLAVGTPVQVYLHLEIGQEEEKKIFRVRFSGKVVRTEPGGFAVGFDEAQQSLMVQEGTPTV
jgi:hypothetical protein